MHIAIQRGPVRIVGDGEVHPHRGKEVVEEFPRDAVLAGAVHDCRQTWVIIANLALCQSSRQLVGKLLQAIRTFGRTEVRIEIVEDVVGSPSEPVERMHRGSLIGGKEPRRKKKRSPVRCVDRAAATIGVTQCRIADASSVKFRTDHVFTTRGLLRRNEIPVIRSAASRPDSIAVGTPTPGTVEDPANTTLSIPRTMLAGRNGPVWPNVCAKANGEPAAIP